MGVEHRATHTSLTLKVPYNREYVHPNEEGSDGDFSNLSYSLKKSYEFKGPINAVSIGLGGFIPAGHEVGHTSFQGSVGPSVTVQEGYGILTATQSASYRYAFYGYDMQDDGTSNAPNNFTIGGDLTLAVYKSLSLSAGATYLHSINFQKTPIGSTLTSLGASVDVMESLSLGIGMYALNGTLSADGQRNEFIFLSPDSTLAFFDLLLKF
jgi:hypothetical protein